MSNARAGPTREFRPTRTTRSTTAATAASTTNSTRARSTSRPPSAGATTNGRPGSSLGRSAASRPGSSAGLSSGLPRASATAAAGRASAPAEPSSATGIGLKRKTRVTSSGADAGQEPAAAKRPALSSAFSAHVTQSSLNRQLLAAQSQVTELQNTLLEKQRDIDRLDGDLRLVSTREEEEKEARIRSEEELTLRMREYEAELSSLKRRLAELEADHEDLGDAYSNLSHTSQTKIAALNLELTTRDERIALLETQLKESEERSREEEIRAKALEELLEQMTEDEPGPEVEEDEEQREHGSVRSQEDGQEEPTDAIMKLEFKEPESSIDDADSPEKTDELDADTDVDAEGEVDPEDNLSASMTVDATEGDITPTGEIEMSRSRSASVAEAHTFYEGGQSEIEAYPDPGAPPPYDASSLTSASARCASASATSRSRSSSIASSNAGSITSSRAMSITLDGPPAFPQSHRSPSGTPLSIASSSRLDPLSHVRRRLSLATPSRRRSSVGASREREKDNEIIRAELARQTSHITTLEATNARLTSEVARLRTRAEGAEVLREEKRELERRVESMESLRTRVAELETTAAEFSTREREWKAKLRERTHATDENSTPAKTPVGVTQQLTALRKAHALLLDEHGQLKASLRMNEMELASAREEVENGTRAIGRLQHEVGQLQDSLTRKEKERVLLERDATFLRSLVSSYKNEEANISVDHGEHPVSTEKLEQRVAQLEALLSEYKATIGSLESEVDRLQRSGGGPANRPQEQWDQLSSKAAALHEAFKNAQGEVTRQREHIDKLEQQLFEMGGEIGSGRHIPPGTRVLSLRRNPAQEWADTRKEVLDSLKTENEALLARLKELEDRGFTSTNSSSESNDDKSQSVPRASWEALKKETEEQQATLAQKEKRLLRLQQVYSAKSAEFREAIESILGLKLAFYPNGQVRLTSVYDLSAAFVFQPSKDGADASGAKMQLVATGDGGPQELEGLMNTWIRDEMCIPCFMSSVTLECYDKWKNEQRAAGFINH